MSETTNKQLEAEVNPEDINLPPNSFWPLILALGLVLIIGGFAVDYSMSIMGIYVTIVGAIGWAIVPIQAQKSD